jgi:hypothetical protein
MRVCTRCAACSRRACLPSSLALSLSPSLPLSLSPSLPLSLSPCLASRILRQQGEGIRMWVCGVVCRDYNVVLDLGAGHTAPPEARHSLRHRLQSHGPQCVRACVCVVCVLCVYCSRQPFLFSPLSSLLSPLSSFLFQMGMIRLQARTHARVAHGGRADVAGAHHNL